MDDTPNTDDGDGLEVADPNDFFVTRDDQDRPDPVRQQIPGTEQALRIRPLTNRHLERWGDVLESDDPPHGVVADVFEYALADFDGEITKEMIDGEMLGYGVAPILQAIKNASGYQAFLGFREQQMQMASMLDGIDAEQLDSLLNLADENAEHFDDMS
jgi:hypothetical protein